MTRIVLAVLAPLLAAATALPAASAEMAFYMKNGTRAGVAVELMSQRRDMRWPGDDQVYFLDVGEKKSVPVECEAGEQICYGAWKVGDDRVRWGDGPDHDEDCADCCFICVAKTTQTIDIR